MKKTILLFFLLSFIAVNPFAQTSSITNNSNLKSTNLIVSQCDTIIKPHDFYEYSLVTPPVGWQLSYGGWAISQAPFGNNIGYDSYFDYLTYWPENSFLYLRKQIDLSDFAIETLNWYLGVDNGYKLFVNGNLVSEAYADGYTFRWEYSGTINPVYLTNGINIIAIECEDRGGLTAFDMMLTGQSLLNHSITNIQAIPRSDGSGIVDVYFNLNGTENSYNITLAVSFDGGAPYLPISSSFLSGDVNSINPGSNKHIVWNGLESYPNTFSVQSKVKIIANPN